MIRPSGGNSRDRFIDRDRSRDHSHVDEIRDISTGLFGPKERWVVSGCGTHYPVEIEFKEDGNGGAYWTIR